MASQIFTGSSIKDFDYAQRLSFGYSVDVDYPTLRAQTEISARATVGAYLLVDCRTSQIRLIETCAVPSQVQ